MTNLYSASSWIDPRIVIRESKIQGKGSFSVAFIKVGEVVTIWGGSLFTVEEVKAGKTKEGTVGAISENLVLAAPAGAPEEPDQYLNHSCDPNLWMENEARLMARRDILPGEELTADYAMWEWDENWVAPWICNCGSRLCRGKITGKDWRLGELHERYRNHFSPFINERITKLKHLTR